MSRRAWFGAALVLDLLGAAGALLVSTRHWQTVSTPQPARLDVLQVSGRTVDSVPTALALVALAGVVAVLATRGWPRRVVGAVLALSGAGLVWRSLGAASAVGTSRARSLVENAHRTVSAAGVTPRVVTHPVWPVLSVVGGVLVLLAGVLIAWQGHRWQSLSARYEAPSATGKNVAEDAVGDEVQARTRAATAMWSALDRGEDPTNERPHDPRT